jgi:hypothetical protein
MVGAKSSIERVPVRRPSPLRETVPRDLRRATRQSPFPQRWLQVLPKFNTLPEFQCAEGHTAKIRLRMVIVHRPVSVAPFNGEIDGRRVH